MNKKNIIIACVIFIVTGAVGYGITKFALDVFSEAGGEGTASGVKTNQRTLDADKADTVQNNQSKSMLEPSVDDNLVAKAEAIKLPKEVKNKAVEAKKGKQITAAQLTSLINGNSNDYPRGIVIRVVGNKPNEQASSIAMIRQYKKMGTWSNITVTNVEYDESNKVHAITVSVLSNGTDSEE